jgi:hypothetical protein
MEGRLGRSRDAAGTPAGPGRRAPENFECVDFRVAELVGPLALILKRLQEGAVFEGNSMSRKQVGGGQEQVMRAGLRALVSLRHDKFIPRL